MNRKTSKPAPAARVSIAERAILGTAQWHGLGTTGQAKLLGSMTGRLSYAEASVLLERYAAAYPELREALPDKRKAEVIRKKRP